MESKAKLLGHPIHPMLIVLPLGLFIAAVIFDVLAMFTGNSTFATVAYWNIAGGIIGGLAAAAIGRNPDAAAQIRGLAIILAAFAEGLGVLAIVVGLLALFIA
jgi:uncharacterized membrane protein